MCVDSTWIGDRFTTSFADDFSVNLVAYKKDHFLVTFPCSSYSLIHIGASPHPSSNGLLNQNLYIHEHTLFFLLTACTSDTPATLPNSTYVYGTNAQEKHQR
jgi:hypothetical protein